MSDVERFAAALRESEARDAAARAAAQKAEAERQRRREEAEAHATELSTARHDLDAAIAAVRTSKSTGKGRAGADAAWKAAKARLIELETGAPPSWAAQPADQEPGEPQPAEASPEEQVEP
jgi:chromosome segregation protein